MLETATEAAFEYHGYRARTVCRIEREAETAAAGVALAQAAGSEAPVHSDLATFDGRPWRGLVDCCVAGLPCPAFSSAGKRTGNSDERAWGTDFDPEIRDTWGPQPHWLRILAEARPALAIFENVPAWVTAGHFRIVGDCLSELGYVVQDPIFVTADSVGGSHKRERVFVLGYLADSEFMRSPNTQASGGRRPGNAAGRGSAKLGDGECEVETVADAGRERSQSRRRIIGLEDGCWRLDATGVAMADGIGNGCRATGHGQQRPAKRPSHRLPLHCPAKGVSPKWIAKRLAEARGVSACKQVVLDARGVSERVFRGWRDALRVDPTLLPSIEPTNAVVADGLAETGDAPVSHASLLRIGGNGVDSLAAATAIATLLADAGIGD